MRISKRIGVFGVGLSVLLVAPGCNRSAGPAQACFQGSATGGLVCSTSQAMTELSAPEPSTTPTEGEKDVDGDGKPDAFLCKSADRNGDGVADIEQEGGDGEHASTTAAESEGDGASASTSESQDSTDDADKDGITDDQECQVMKEHGKVDGDADHDGLGDSVDPDDDNDGIPDAQDPDRDGDGIPNASDTDNDEDGVPDLLDSK